MAEHERTVAHAAFRYRDAGGRNRIALRGARIVVDDDTLERGERLGALVEGDIAPAPTGAMPIEPISEDTAAGSGGEEPGDDTGEKSEPAPARERPPQVAAKGVWVDYAVSRGMDRAEAEDLTKPQLIAAVDKLGTPA